MTSGKQEKLKEGIDSENSERMRSEPFPALAIAIPAMLY